MVRRVQPGWNASRDGRRGRNGPRVGCTDHDGAFHPQGARRPGLVGRVRPECDSSRDSRRGRYSPCMGRPPRSGRDTRSRGHTGKIWSAAYSPDKSRLVTASADGTARVWDVRMGRIVHSLRGHKSPVWSVAFSPAGDRIMTASADGSVREWDSATAAAIRILRQPAGNSTVVALGRDGSVGVIGRGDGTLTCWDGRNGADIVTVNGHRGAVYAAAFISGGT